MVKLEVKNAGLPKLKATQAELEASQAELEATQAELEASQTELENTQTELEATQTELEASQEQVVQLREQLQELQRQQAKDTHDSSSPSPDDDTTRFLGWILLPMRIFLGLTFIYAGIQKLTDPQFFNPLTIGYIGNQIKGFAQGSPLHDFLMGVALPHAVLFGWATSLGEIAIGLATYAGLLFRPAAFFGMLMSLTFFLSASWNTYPYFYGADIVFVFCWITMILSGPLNTGLPSVDEWLIDQLVPGGHTGQKLHPILQLYIFLVAAAAPQKSSYIAGISLFKTTRSSLQGHQHESSATQTTQMTRRSILQDWVVGVAAVASITVLGIPLRIFGNDPNASVAVVNNSTTDTSSTTNNPDMKSTSDAASNSDTGSTTATSATPINLTKPVAAGETIGQRNAVPKNSFVTFTLASSKHNAILIHLPDDTFVAYDVTCTHAGSRVAYQPDTHTLACPLHGSQFDPARGAAVVRGPAAVPLSALSVQIDSATGAIKLQSGPS
jgi:thiosulfate dehydrogenase (quinone) large subunit